MAERRKKSRWLAKKSENKEIERCSKNQIDYYTMWKTVKAIVEEHFSSVNIHTDIDVNNKAYH